MKHQITKWAMNGSNRSDSLTCFRWNDPRIARPIINISTYGSTHPNVTYCPFAHEFHISC